MDEEFEKAKAAMEVPYLAFKWDEGFIVISQQAFEKMNERKKKILLAPMKKGRNK